MISIDLVLPILTAEEVAIVAPCFSRKRTLRTNKPFARAKTMSEACANYVWRMLAFDFSAYGKNSCMPVMADWDIGTVLYNRDKVTGCMESNRETRRSETKDILDKMDALVKKVESVLPITAQAGAMRWGRALGMI